MTIEDEIITNAQVKACINLMNNRSLKNCEEYSESIPLDDWEIAYKNEQRFAQALVTINVVQDRFVFEIGGDAFRPDLVITSKRLKKEYDLIPKTKTFADLFQVVNDVYGIKTSTEFHVDLDTKMTDQEFDEHMKFYEKMSNSNIFGSDEDETD